MTVTYPLNQGREVAVDVLLGDDVGPDDVKVQVLEGPVDPDGNIKAAKIGSIEKAAEAGPNRYRFSGVVKCGSSGLRGIAMRVVPRNPLLGSGVSSGMVKWPG